MKKQPDKEEAERLSRDEQRARLRAIDSSIRRKLARRLRDLAKRALKVLKKN